MLKSIIFSIVLLVTIDTKSMGTGSSIIAKTLSGLGLQAATANIGTAASSAVDAAQAGEEENHVPNLETDPDLHDEKNFLINAGKFGNFICRPRHLGISNVHCIGEKEWEYLKKELCSVKCEKKKQLLLHN